MTDGYQLLSRGWQGQCEGVSLCMREHLGCVGCPYGVGDRWVRVRGSGLEKRAGRQVTPWGAAAEHLAPGQ